jgi:AbrB family looped-hinge helix DNA binding protein
MISTVTSKGQITIPKSIRQRYSIAPHDKIDFIIQDDMIIIKPVKTLRDLRGCVTASGSDFGAERQAAKEMVGRRFTKEKT